MTCGRHLANDPQPTYQIWTQLVKSFLRYRNAVWGYLCACARAEIPHPWLLHKLYLMGPRVHAKFQRNRPSRYRETAGGTFVTSPQVARATCYSGLLAWFGIGPIHGRRDGGTHQRRPLVNRAFGSRDISLSKAWPRPAGRPVAHTQDFLLFSVELARPSASLVIMIVITLNESYMITWPPFTS